MMWPGLPAAVSRARPYIIGLYKLFRRHFMHSQVNLKTSRLPRKFNAHTQIRLDSAPNGRLHRWDQARTEKYPQLTYEEVPK